MRATFVFGCSASIFTRVNPFVMLCSVDTSLSDDFSVILLCDDRKGVEVVEMGPTGAAQ